MPDEGAIPAVQREIGNQNVWWINYRLVIKPAPIVLNPTNAISFRGPTTLVDEMGEAGRSPGVSSKPGTNGYQSFGECAFFLVPDCTLLCEPAFDRAAGKLMEATF